MMKIPDDIDLFLPRYLSDTSKETLIKELKNFPTDGSKDVIYTSALDGVDYLLQGDGVKDVDYVSFPDVKHVGKVPVILISNTCDMSIGNHRINDCRIMFVPILNLDKYQKMLLEKGISSKRIEQHINDIRSQYITQILYLPKGKAGIGLGYEGIAFFDRALSIPLNDDVNRKFVSNKIFTLSDFGFYLFLLKLSYHFTRIQERIDRNSGIDVGEQKIIH